MVSKRSIYFDYNATRPVRESVKKLLQEMYEYTGNASSVHQKGSFMKQKLEAARDSVGQLLSVSSKNIFWTSGATESNNMVLKGYKGPVIVSAVEHPSVYDAREDKLVCPVDAQGVICMDALEKLLKACEEGPLVCIAAAMTETGAIQPLDKVIKLVHQYKGFVFADCVQAVGKIEIPFDKLDGFSLSGHKIGAPFGIGMVYVKPKLKIESLLIGGGQESYKRAGTVNVYGVLAFEQALRETLTEKWDYVEKLRKNLENGLKQIYGDVMIVSEQIDRLPHTSGFIVPGVLNTVQMMHYDLEGCCVSLGAACSSGTMKTSGVLERMHIAKDLAQCFVRISLGQETTLDEIRQFLEITRQLKERGQKKYA